MAPSIGTPGLIGRETELTRVREWVGLIPAGPAGLLVRGAAGIGKTALWSAAIVRATEAGAQILVARPAEAELPLGHAALGDLLGVIAGSILDQLPDPLARALAGALFLREEPEAADPLAVARATLAALRALAARSPLVVAIDDAQWLDAASARSLSFALRRLQDAQIGFALTMRDGHADPLSLATALGERLIDVPLRGLSVGATGHVLRARVDPQMRRHTLLRLHERSGGNPFVALELALAGDEGLPASLREIVARRLAAAPRRAWPAIELACVLGPTPVGSPAFEQGDALAAGIAAGILVEEDGEVRFSHPLLAAGAYEQIPIGRRRVLHLRAAELTRGVEASARHRAIAADAPDATVAALLDDAAAAARSRGAPEAAAELMAYARRLTPAEDAESLMRRTMDEADHRYLSADEPAARTLVDQVIASGARGTVRVRALVLRALFDVDPRPAVARLEEAAHEPHDDGRLAARTLAQLAWQRGAWLGDVERAVPEALAAVELAEGLGDEPTLATTLTAAGLVESLAGFPAAEAHFRRALEITDRQPTAAGDHTPRIAYAHQRWWRGDWATAEALLRDERRHAEQHGDESLLMRLNVFTAEFELRRGNWDEAERFLEAGLADARDYWRVIGLIQRAFLRARRGDRAALADAEEIAASPLAGGEPVVAAAADYAIGLIDFADGQVAKAADRLLRLPTLSDRSGSRRLEFAFTIPDAVLVLAEADRPSEAEALTEQLERRSVQLGPWGVAAVSLCRGALLLADGETANAVDRLAHARRGFEAIMCPWELGKTLLMEGNALRRQGRRREASGLLERAVPIFERLAASPSRERAIAELRRARPRPRRDDSLTAAEGRVAGLVAGGRTNKEVAAQLFTTVATVEAHLTRIYSKVGVRSRTELARRVADGTLNIAGGADLSGFP